jgi:hypothetical protein
VCVCERETEREVVDTVTVLTYKPILGKSLSKERNAHSILFLLDDLASCRAEPLILYIDYRVGNIPNRDTFFYIIS